MPIWAMLLHPCRYSRFAGALAAGLALAVALGADTAQAQPVIYTLTTPNPQVNANFSIPSMGDTNGDGKADIAVGAGSETVSGMAQQGRAYVYSGATGGLLRTLTTPNPQANGLFGYRVFANADVDGDGKADVIVSAPYENVVATGAQGRAYVFSGATGALLYTLTTPNPQANAHFGLAIGAGDTDADGKADIAVGAPDETVGANSGQGRVYVFSGATGLLLRPLDKPTPQPSAAFGNSIAMGNVDADAKADVVVGASGETVAGKTEQGRTYVFSGANGSLLYPLVSPNPQSYSGCCSVATGDMDGDGRADIAMGAMHEDVGVVAGQGRVYVFSGATGGLLRTLTTPNPVASPVYGFGAFVSMGDVFQAGKADIAVSASWEQVGSHPAAGRAYLFSAQTGSLLYALDSPNAETNGLFGYVPIGRLADVNGDGKADLAVGAFNETAGGNAGQGRVYVFSGPPAVSVGGIAEQPDASALPVTTTSSDHTTAFALGGTALAVLVTVGAGGWYVRRKRAG
jgi:hypothetical protein